MSTPLSIGKLRGLQQCSSPEKTIAVLALDHRNNLRNAMNPQAPNQVTDLAMTAFKQAVVTEVAPQATAVLLDPEVGGSQCIASGALSGQVGLIMAVEATGYTGDPTARQSRILPGWSIAKVRRMGANAVKLLVYYHPDSPTAGEQESFVRQVAIECRKQDVPLFLEPLSYSLNPEAKKLAPAERRRVVIETARRLVVPGVDILKAEFPLDVSAETNERVWAEACAELSETCPAPWVLLSASVPYETFLRQVTVACQAGASGVAVGRAVWQEAPLLRGAELSSFLRDVAKPRMAGVMALCRELGRPWSDFYSTPTPDSHWYEQYSNET
jgi:tagatose 1,6-diphosphate aldolase